MLRSKKCDSKVILVRNAERAVPPTRLLTQDNSEEKMPKKTIATKPSNQDTNFNRPEINSTLHLLKKIDSVENAPNCRKKNTANLAFDEKVSRNVNFPSDRAIYKDLIPLHVATKPQIVPASRDPLPQRDLEPTLTDFITGTKSKEFIYKPEIKNEEYHSAATLNCLKLYNVMKMHTE